MSGPAGLLGPESTFDYYYKDNQSKAEFYLTVLRYLVINEQNCDITVKYKITSIISQVLSAEQIVQDSQVSGVFKAAARLASSICQNGKGMIDFLNEGNAFNKLI